MTRCTASRHEWVVAGTIDQQLDIIHTRRAVVYACKYCLTGRAVPVGPVEDPLPGVAEWAETDGGQLLHASWRDRMIEQRREVSHERRMWATLPEQDRELDRGIARDIVSAYLRSGEKHEVQQPDPGVHGRRDHAED